MLPPFLAIFSGKRALSTPFPTAIITFRVIAAHDIRRKRAIRDGGGRPPLPFFENRKKCPDFGKKALIVSILGLNLPFKM